MISTLYSVRIRPYGSRIIVNEGDNIKKGTRLTEGASNPHDILRILGADEVQNYLIQEVQKTYRQQGVKINDKHIEVIIRQMMKRVKIENSGDSPFLQETTEDKNKVIETNEQLEAEGKEPAEYTQRLMGITKASIETDSFLSAASFQETPRVLTDAAIKGKRDPLLGLKENVIIGKLIPAGTGMKRYSSIQLNDLTAKPEEQQAEAQTTAE